MLVLCLIVAAMAVARLSMLITQDQLLLPLRMWVIRRFGEDSKMEYLVHCDWCTSIWIAAPIMPLTVWAATSGGWWLKGALMGLLIPAASLIAGLLSKLRG